MRRQDIQRLVTGTGDPAFVVNAQGVITAWNAPCEAFFGTPAAQVVGAQCGPVIQGTDECGDVCGERCCILGARKKRRMISSFDLRVATAHGPRWSSVSVLMVEESGEFGPSSVHILRDIDMHKRLEGMVREFAIATPPGEPPQHSHPPAQVVELTKQETTVLRLLAKGVSGAAIAGQLHISRVTVNNHVQHALHKLGAHTRLDAIRRAERAGLL